MTSEPTAHFTLWNLASQQVQVTFDLFSTPCFRIFFSCKML